MLILGSYELTSPTSVVVMMMALEAVTSNRNAGSRSSTSSKKRPKTGSQRPGRPLNRPAAARYGATSTNELGRHFAQLRTFTSPEHSYCAGHFILDCVPRMTHTNKLHCCKASRSVQSLSQQSTWRWAVEMGNEKLHKKQPSKADGGPRPVKEEHCPEKTQSIARDVPKSRKLDKMTRVALASEQIPAFIYYKICKFVLEINMEYRLTRAF